jgi:hypothetical protein
MPMKSTPDDANFAGVNYVTESLKRVRAAAGADATCRLALEMATAAVMVLALQGGKQRALNALDGLFQQVEML